MSTVMSALGEMTGMKPGDDIIVQTGMVTAKSKAQLYLAAILECTNPELRQLFTTHLQDTLAEHQRYTEMALKHGWYKAEAGADQLITQALGQAKATLH
ncbi:MAG: spore coat protein [Mycobacterium leprae]